MNKDKYKDGREMSWPLSLYKSIPIIFKSIFEKDLFTQSAINFSYGKVNQSIVLSKENRPKDSDIAKQQTKNKGELGNLSKQLDQTKPIIGLISEIIKNVPGVKNNSFLLKPMDLALKFGNANFKVINKIKERVSEKNNNVFYLSTKGD